MAEDSTHSETGDLSERSGDPVFNEGKAGKPEAENPAEVVLVYNVRVKSKSDSSMKNVFHFGLNFQSK